jgi:divalent metal cation (Fe/Co/Zn/Cd) transporter
VLEWITIVWNSLEAIVSLVAGAIVGSVSLVGFGLDSVIETASGVALLWRLHHSNEATAERREKAEKLALKVVGASFLALACYVAVDAALTLVEHKGPEPSVAGIVVAALSLVVMPVLARAKRQVARKLRSDAMHRESRQTDICAWLSAILLGGLMLNAALGWWWADPLAALVMVPIIAREGVEALKGKPCGCHGDDVSCAAESGS